MSLQKNLNELLEAGVINQETAASIEAYYRGKESSWSKRLLTIFGVLGAILVGLGIILVIAHNWDELTRSVKTIFAFLPLIIGQAACVYTLLKQNNNQAWREGSASFLFFAVGACMALISQIYHLDGDTASFLFTWLLLCLPVVYLLRSSFTSLLYIAGITWYAILAGYTSYPTQEPFDYWLLMIAILPFYYQLYRQNARSNFVSVHHWFVPVSLSICLGTLANNSEDWMLLAYLSLFGTFYLIGTSSHFSQAGSSLINRANGYRVIGTLGTISILLGLSFDEFWQDLSKPNYFLRHAFVCPEFFAALFFTTLGLIILSVRLRQNAGKISKPLEVVFVVFLFIYFLGFVTPLSVVLVNLLVLYVGIQTIRLAAQNDHLGQANFGLLVLAALVICRFFDSDLSFVIRGLLFIAVGVGFFIANYRILKKRKNNEE